VKQKLNKESNISQRADPKMPAPVFKALILKQQDGMGKHMAMTNN
jgi:hypothetical protein